MEMVIGDLTFHNRPARDEPVAPAMHDYGFSAAHPWTRLHPQDERASYLRSMPTGMDEGQHDAGAISALQQDFDRFG